MATMRLTTWDRQHRLRVYHPEHPREDGRHGQMWADSPATADGPDETFEVVPDGDAFGLRIHGKFVSIQPDGRIEVNRDALLSWERFRWVRGEDGGRGLQSVEWGCFLRVEGGGGSTVNTVRYDAPQPWESFFTEGSVVVGGPLSRLRVEDNRRFLANDAGRFDYREVSAFSLLSRLLVGEVDAVRGWLQRRRAEGFTVARNILTLDGPYWIHSPHGRSFRSAPDMPGYWEALDQLVALHADAGLYLDAVFLGALEAFGGVWHPDRRDVYEGGVRERAEQFVVEAAQRIGGHPHVLGELANEPTQIGMRRAWDNGALVSLGRKVKAVAPAMLLCGGEDNDGQGVTAPFDIADAHMDRSGEVGGWRWVKRSGEHPTADQTLMPFRAGEPRNFGERRADGNTGDGPESQPAVAFGAAAVGRARKWAGQCFHFDGGLWTTEPQDATKRCITAWHQGMDAFPLLNEGLWRGHWGLSRGDYFSDRLWPDTDDPRAVEDILRRGDHAWRVFGNGPYGVLFAMSKGLDWRRHLDAPAELVTFIDGDAFDAAVFRRL